MRPRGSEWRGAESVTLEVLPERLAIGLPEGVEAGDLRVSFGYFPGWEVQVDGGDWVPAGRKSWLLAAEIPDGAREVLFRYSAWRPWDRAIGFGISALTALGLLGFGSRRRWREG